MELGVDVDGRDTKQRTALIWACTEGKKDVALTLARQRCNLDLQDSKV